MKCRAEYRGRRADYARVVIDEMIPAVAAERLAEWCDVFCEDGVFTPDESRAILEAGKRHGLKARIHADELGSSGGAGVAADVGAHSADHLIFVDEPHARRMRDAGVVATLLPAAAFFLKLGRFAPARMLIDQQVPVALATDINPGGGFTTSMPFVMALACFGMNMTLEEALVGATLNAAASIDRVESIGSLEAGKQFDAVVIGGVLSDLIRVGGPVISHVIKRGRIEFTAVTRFADLTVAALLDALASPDPTPGGGTASAIAGAMGASLLIMVTGLAKSKTNTDDEKAALEAARLALEPLRAELMRLADADSDAFDQVMAAYRRPKATDEEKAARIVGHPGGVAPGHGGAARDASRVRGGDAAGGAGRRSRQPIGGERRRRGGRVAGSGRGRRRGQRANQSRGLERRKLQRERVVRSVAAGGRAGGGRTRGARRRSRRTAGERCTPGIIRVLVEGLNVKFRE